MKENNLFYLQLIILVCFGQIFCLCQVISCVIIIYRFWNSVILWYLHFYKKNELIFNRNMLINIISNSSIFKCKIIFVLIKISIFQQIEKNVMVFFYYYQQYVTIQIKIYRIWLMFYLIKNYKLNLRYQGIRIKNHIKINKFYSITLICKLVINFSFAILLTEQTLVYVFFIMLVNLLQSYVVWNNVCYENARLEYNLMVWMFYSWMPVSKTMIQYVFEEKLSSICWYYLPFVLCMIFSVKKPRFFMKLLERKYLAKIKQFNSKAKSVMNHGTQNKKQQEQIITIISILINICQQEQNQENLPWSQTMKSEVYQLLRRYKNVNKNINEQQKKKDDMFSGMYLKPQEQYQSKDYSSSQFFYDYNPNSHNQELINNLFGSDYQSKNPAQSQANRLNEIIWNMLTDRQIFISTNTVYDTSYHNLRYFLCYIFSDRSNLMISRLFYLYYLNRKTNENIYEKIEGEMCYEFLVEKIGSHKLFNKCKKREYYGGEERNNMKNSDKSTINLQTNNNKLTTKTLNFKQSLNKKYSVFNEFQQDCLFKQNLYYNPKFNEVIKQNQIFTKILWLLDDFILNQKKITTKQQDVKIGQIFVYNYYDQRNRLRVQIKQEIQSYKRIMQRNMATQLLLEYIQEVYLESNPYIGYENFIMGLENYLIYQKQQKKVIQGRKGTEFALSTKTMKNIKDKKMSLNKEYLTCVTSGIQQMGAIVLCCSKFKQIMQVKSNNNKIQKEQLYSNMTINEFLLPFCKQKHQMIMKNSDIYEKPIDHLKKSYWMISLKHQNLINAKFKIYFFMNQKSDLLLISNIYYQKVDQLIIQNSNHKKIFEYKRSNQFDEDNSYKQSQQTLQLFNQTYFVRQNKSKQKFSLFLDAILPQTKSYCQIDYDRQLQNKKHFHQKRTNQLKYNQYKQQFKPFKGPIIKLLCVTGLMSILFIIGFQFLLFQSKNNIKVGLDNISSKRLIQNEFCLYNSYSGIDLGIIYNSVIGRLKLDKQKTLQLKKLVVNSILNYEHQMKTRFELNTFDRFSIEQIKNLFSAEWIEGRELSFIYDSLRETKRYLEILEMFIDQQKIEEILASNYDDKKQANSQKVSTKSKRLLLNQVSYHIRLSSDQIYDQIINFNITLTQQEQKTILEYIQQSQHDHSYFYDSNGIIDTLIHYQKNKFVQLNSNFNLIYVLVYLMVIGFNFVVFYKIAKINKEINLNFNYTMELSDKFRNKKGRNMGNLSELVDKMRNLAQNQIFEYIKPESVNLKEISQKRTFVNSTVTVLPKEDFSVKQNKKNTNCFQMLFFQLQYFKCSIFRLIVLIALLYLFYKDYDSRMHRIQNYSLALSQFSKNNAKYIKALQLNLFVRAFHNKLQTKKIFQQTMKQIIQQRKVLFFNDLFLNKDEMNKFMYENICDDQEIFGIECPEITQEIFVGFESLKSSSIHSLYLLSSDQLDPVHWYHDPSKLFLQNYGQIISFLFFTQQIAHYTLDQLQKSSILNYKLIFIGLVLKLIFFFFHEIYRFYKINKIFNQQFLKIGSMDELKKQRGYFYFINQSKQKKKFFIHQQLTFQLQQ